MDLSASRFHISTVIDDVIGKSDFSVLTHLGGQARLDFAFGEPIGAESLVAMLLIGRYDDHFIHGVLSPRFEQQRNFQDDQRVARMDLKKPRNSLPHSGMDDRVQSL